MERNSTRDRSRGGCRMARSPHPRTPTTHISNAGGNVFVSNSTGHSTFTYQDALVTQECNNRAAPAPHTLANTTLPPSRASVTEEIRECQRNFGKASSTQATNKAAIAKFDKYCREKLSMSQTDIDREYVEGDLLVYHLVKYASYLGKNLIPHERSPDKFMGVKTLLNYFGAAKELLRARFPDHPAWKEADKGDKSGWYNQLYSGLDKEAKRTASGETRGGPGCLPLYRVSGEKDYFPNRRGLVEEGKAKDLVQICYCLMSGCTLHTDLLSEKLMQQRFQIVTDFLACGRAGEIKFLRWDEARWDEFFQSPSLVWSEMKTMKEYTMMFVPDADDFPLDWLHAFASYACVERGIAPGPDVPHMFHRFVFPDLHAVKDAYVAKLLTRSLRKYVGLKVASNVSSRSLREGAGTALAMHPNISDAEMRARGGWADQSNSKHYFNDCPSLNLPGAAALSGHHDCHRRFHWPRLEAIENDVEKEDLQKFVDCLIPTTIECFLPTGDLYPLRQAAVASLLMYFENTMKTLTCFNALNRRMLDVAMKYMQWRGDDRYRAAELINNWGKTIRADYEERNDTSSARDLKETLLQQAQTIGSMQATLSSLHSKIEDMSSSFSVLQTMLANVSSGSAAMVGRRVSPTSSKKKEPPPGATMETDEPAVTAHQDGADNESDSSYVHCLGSLGNVPPADTPRRNHESDGKKRSLETFLVHPMKKAATSSGSGMKPMALVTDPTYQQVAATQLSGKMCQITVSRMLELFYESYMKPKAGQMNNVTSKVFISHATSISSLHPSLGKKNFDTTRRVLVLIAKTITTGLLKDYMDAKSTHAAAKEIEARCVAWVAEYERKHKVVDLGKRKIQPKVCGLGARLRACDRKLKNKFETQLPSTGDDWEPGFA